MISDLFANNQPTWREDICAGVVVLRGFALDVQNILLDDLQKIISAAPLRKMATPGGLPMSVATTNCGAAGWVSDANGYRYEKHDNQSRQQWPAMPDSFLMLARNAASVAGFENFLPDSCLINCYIVGAKMSLHKDKDERDFTQPIVSVSLGLPATFLMGGMQRSDKTIHIPLVHGDVMVWGGPARLNFHGVLPVKKDIHFLLDEQRINLTFRKAL